MDEIKIENNLNVVCHGCLSSDRHTAALGSYSDMFLNIIGNHKQNMIYGVEDIKFCWECMAVLKKCKSFQNQLIKAQNVLMQMLYELDYIPISLSNITTIKKYYYDQDYQHIETCKKKKHKDIEYEILDPNKEITHTNKEFTHANKELIDTNNEITNNKKKCEDVEIFVEIPNKISQDIDVDNVDTSIKEEEYNVEYDSYIDDEIYSNHDKDSDYKQNSDISTYNVQEYEQKTNNSKPARAKRRKLVKSRDNSVGYYKQYARLIEREKIDWGKVEDYFTMTTFGEAEMEEHFLSKERKFSLYLRFKYKCVPCELGFMKSFDLKRHNDLNHHKKVSYKCSLCHKQQSSQQNLESHWREHTPIAKCNICHDVCRPRGMKNHLNYAHTQKYACQFCNLTFGKILHFSIHYKDMHQNYICDYCNASCKSKILVQKHIRTHHTKFTCKECDRLYPNYRQYKRHNNEMHAYKNDGKERPELAYCVECDKQYSSVSKYKKHLKISPKHTEIKRIMLPCPDCGKIFKRKNYLNNHYNLYHAKKSKHYCELCDKYFANGYGLRKHKTHVHLKVTRVKDKMCDLCGRGFATNRILLNHRRTHTGERPYQCPFCTAAFTQKQAMQSHCRTQHKDVK